MNAVKEMPTLTKLRNYNNCLYNKYFGQVALFPENWQRLIGTVSRVDHQDIRPGSIVVELLNVIPLEAYELRERKDMAFFINHDNIPTLWELCGFDNKTFREFEYITGFRGKTTVGLFIFKNLIYSL